MNICIYRERCICVYCCRSQPPPDHPALPSMVHSQVAEAAGAERAQDHRIPKIVIDKQSITSNQYLPPTQNR